MIYSWSSDDSTVSFIFGLEVNWDLLQQREEETRELVELRKLQVKKDLEELNERRRKLKCKDEHDNYDEEEGEAASAGRNPMDTNETGKCIGNVEHNRGRPKGIPGAQPVEKKKRGRKRKEVDRVVHSNELVLALERNAPVIPIVDLVDSEGDVCLSKESLTRIEEGVTFDSVNEENDEEKGGLVEDGQDLCLMKTKNRRIILDEDEDDGEEVGNGCSNRAVLADCTNQLQSQSSLSSAADQDIEAELVGDSTDKKKRKKEKKRRPAEGEDVFEGTSPSSLANHWSCDTCTFMNVKRSRCCGLCGFVSNLPSIAEKSYYLHQDD